MGAIQIRIVQDPDKIAELDDRINGLAASARSALPFHQWLMPVTWWKHFHSRDGIGFAERRGRNFLGTRSRLESLHFILAEEDGMLRGVLPLVTYAVKVRGKAEDTRVLAFCGDSVLMAYQDLLVDPERPEAADSLFDAAMKLMEDGRDVLFLGCMPEGSPNRARLELSLGRHREMGWEGGFAPNRSRGGVHPWTLHRFQGLFRKLGETLAPDHACLPSARDIAAGLEAASPQSLIFPATRLGLENRIKGFLTELEATGYVGEESARIADALRPAIIPYFHAFLPADEEAYWLTLGKSSRGNLRRMKRRFLEDGGGFEKLSPEQVTPQDIEDYLRLHRLRWGADSAALSDATVAFHRELSLALARKGVFCLFFATYRGRRVASHSCIDVFGRREGFFLGRDPDLPDHSIGSLLCVEPILDAVMHGYTEYNFGHGGDEYKTSLAKNFSRTMNMLVFRGNRPPDTEKIFTGYEHIALD